MPNDTGRITFQDWQRKFSYEYPTDDTSLAKIQKLAKAAPLLFAMIRGFRP